MVLAHIPVTDPFAWRPHPEVWVVMIASLAVYFWALKQLGPRYVSAGDEPVSRNQILCFVSGVALLWIGADWPMHELSEDFLFSAHMLQHLIFSLMAAPLLLMGTPGWMARLILKPRWLLALMRRVTRPLPAMFLFNGYLVFSHWPRFVDATTESEPLHFFAHLFLMITALVMWWPVLSPLPEVPRISSPAQMLYVFLQTIVPTVPASFLTFAESAFYATYEAAPRLFSSIDPVADQRLAGLVMKLGGGLLLWAVIAVLFFRWSSREESGTPDAVDWQDLERKLNQQGSAAR